MCFSQCRIPNGFHFQTYEREPRRGLKNRNIYKREPRRRLKNRNIKANSAEYMTKKSKKRRE